MVKKNLDTIYVQTFWVSRKVVYHISTWGLCVQLFSLSFCSWRVEFPVMTTVPLRLMAVVMYELAGSEESGNSATVLLPNDRSGGPP